MEDVGGGPPIAGFFSRAGGEDVPQMGPVKHMGLMRNGLRRSVPICLMSHNAPIHGAFLRRCSPQPLPAASNSKIEDDDEYEDESPTSHL
jgi:hypothetical protein